MKKLCYMCHMEDGRQYEADAPETVEEAECENCNLPATGVADESTPGSPQ